MKDDAILILGAGGFIGRHLAEAIARSGRRVIAATRTPTAYDHEGISNAVAPFDDPAQFSSLLQYCDAVIHAASTSTPGSSAAQPQLDGNLRTTLSLIEALQARPDRRLLYLSSGGTLYGDCAASARETEPLRPRSYHGAGKAAAEHFIHAWAAQYDGTAVILRPSNIYGPGQLPRKGFGVVPAAFECAISGSPLEIWGPGTTVRDYLYIDDFVELSRLVLERDLSKGAHVFNAGVGLGTSLNDLLDAIELVTGRSFARNYKPARLVDVHQIVPDSSAARTTFAWFPKTSLEEGLPQAWQWFSTRQ